MPKPLPEVENRGITFDSTVAPGHWRIQPTADWKQYFRFLVGNLPLGIQKCFHLGLRPRTVEPVDWKPAAAKQLVGRVDNIEKYVYISAYAYLDLHSSNPCCSRVSCVLPKTSEVTGRETHGTLSPDSRAGGGLRSHVQMWSQLLG